MRQKRWQLHKIWCSSATSVVRAKAVNIICTMCFQIPAIKTLRPAACGSTTLSAFRSIFHQNVLRQKYLTKVKRNCQKCWMSWPKTRLHWLWSTSYVQHSLCENALNGTSGLKENILSKSVEGITVEWGTTPGQGLRRIEMIRTSAKLRELTWIYSF